MCMKLYKCIKKKEEEENLTFMTSRVSNLLCNPTKFRFLEMQKKRFTENELQSSAGGRDGQITSTFSLI